MTLFVYRLSLEQLKLAIAELEAIIKGERISLKRSERIGEFLLTELPDDDAKLVAERAALVKEYGRLIAIIPITSLQEVVNEILRLVPCVGKVESARAVHAREAKELFSALVSRRAINRGCGIKVALVDGVALLYEFRKMGREARFGARAPHKRPTYLPGTMTPWLARVFVNLAAVSTRLHEVVLDPFCGVGGFALEAGSQGVNVICGDIDSRMVLGAQNNIVGYRIDSLADVARWDASLLPLRSSSVDGIATDPPYGRMSFPQRFGLSELLLRFIDEGLNVVRNGRRIVFAVPMTIDGVVRDKVESLMRRGVCRVVERVTQFVHSSLTRIIYVVEKG